MMELKPCPFCGYGGEPEIMTWREPYRSNIVYGVQCMACGAIGEMGKTRELAAKHWNERAERSAEVVDTTDGIITVSAYGDCLAITDEYACRDCRWWSVAEYEHGPTTELTCGYCRRFPPYCEIVNDDDGHGQRLMGHPLCYAGDDICGEFSPRGW